MTGSSRCSRRRSARRADQTGGQRIVNDAPARYLTDRWLQSTHGTGFPWGTFTVNVVASFVLGLVTGLAGHRRRDARDRGPGRHRILRSAVDLVHPRLRDGPPRRGTAWTHVAFNIIASVLAVFGAAGLGFAIVEGIAL